MKTQAKHKLDFTKSSVLELNDFQLKEVNGGSTLVSIPISIVVSIIVTTTINANK